MSGADVILITPGPDLEYFIGHSVGSHERLTCLVVPAGGEPSLLVPTLERPGWAGTPAEDPGHRDQHLDRRPGPLPGAGRPAAVGLPGARRRLPHARRARPECAGDRAGLRTDPGRGGHRRAADAQGRRTRSSALAAAGAAIDRVQRRIGEWLTAGRTENEVAADIATAIVDEGHARPDFVIVGSGPNGASPHHEASDRVIEPGDVVVIDIGGPMPVRLLLRLHPYLRRRARRRSHDRAEGRRGVRDRPSARRPPVWPRSVPGSPPSRSTQAARAVIEQAGYGEYFITRTGHGIGLEVHEHPYMVRRQRHGAGTRNGVLRRAGHLSAGRVRGADRGHRGGRRERPGADEHGADRR